MVRCVLFVGHILSLNGIDQRLLDAGYRIGNYGTPT